MNSSKLFAFVLIALGIMAFAYQTLPDTIREQAIGPATLPVKTERTNAVTLAMIAGAVALAGGIVVLVIDRTDRSV
jgi:hypothetical protein